MASRIGIQMAKVGASDDDDSPSPEGKKIRRKSEIRRTDAQNETIDHNIQMANKYKNVNSIVSKDGIIHFQEPSSPAISMN